MFAAAIQTNLKTEESFYEHLQGLDAGDSAQRP